MNDYWSSIARSFVIGLFFYFICFLYLNPLNEPDNLLETDVVIAVESTLSGVAIILAFVGGLTIIQERSKRRGLDYQIAGPLYFGLIMAGVSLAILISIDFSLRIGTGNSSVVWFGITISIMFICQLIGALTYCSLYIIKTSHIIKN